MRVSKRLKPLSKDKERKLNKILMGIFSTHNQELVKARENKTGVFGFETTLGSWLELSVLEKGISTRSDSKELLEEIKTTIRIPFTEMMKLGREGEADQLLTDGIVKLKTKLYPFA